MTPPTNGTAPTGTYGDRRVYEDYSRTLPRDSEGNPMPAPGTAGHQGSASRYVGVGTPSDNLQQQVVRAGGQRISQRMVSRSLNREGRDALRDGTTQATRSIAMDRGTEAAEARSSRAAVRNLTRSSFVDAGRRIANRHNSDSGN